jgi:phage terminase small subunit
MGGALTPRQKFFVGHYTNPQGGSFCEGTKSYMKAYPEAGRKTANVESCRLLKRPEIQTAIEREFEAQGFTDEIASRVLTAQVTGEAVRQQKRYQPEKSLSGEPVLGENGEPKMRLIEVVEMSPSFKDQQSAIDLKAKLTGHYQKLEAVKEAVADELQELYREVQAEVSRVRGKK